MKKFVSAVFASLLVAASTSFAACAAPESESEKSDTTAEEPTQKAPTTHEESFGFGNKCGTHYCSKYQACCDGPKGPYCTTTACE